MAVYLDNAATSFPKPAAVYDKLKGYLERFGACPGRGSYQMAREAEAVVGETRQLLSELFGAKDPQRIAFTLNATDALNMGIKGVLTPGDHVVTTVMEHNSVTRPLNALEHAGQITVTRVQASPEGLVDPADVQAAITDKTKLVAVVHASNVTGSIQPIDEIGQIVRKKERLFLVDAAQTAGSFPIDVKTSGIDLLAFPGHKGLMGPPGTGGLVVGERVTLSPWREGGTGVESETPLQPEAYPLRMEAGSPNTLGIAALAEAVRFILQYGVEWIHQKKRQLTQNLLEGLEGIDSLVVHGPKSLDQRTSVISVLLKGQSAQAVADLLDQKYQIGVRAGLHCAPGVHQLLKTNPEGTVRISPGYFTKEEEIQLCIEALNEIAHD